MAIYRITRSGTKDSGTYSASISAGSKGEALRKFKQHVKEIRSEFHQRGKIKVGGKFEVKKEK